MTLSERINASLGNTPADLLLKNAKLVNTLSGEIHETSIAVHGKYVSGFGDYDARETVDLKGAYVCPGFVDGHLHLESSMLAVPEFAFQVAPLGTTAVVADPHEIANVLGVTGIRYMLDTSKDLPVTVFLMLPSCVPATPFETSGASLGPSEMTEFLNEPRILGLAEMMNFPGVLFQDPDVLSKLELFSGRVIDGHSPGLSGKSLCAYIAAGIRSDHECTTLDEAREKLRCGMHILIREGSAAKNLNALLPLVNEFNSRNCSLVTDDLEPGDIVERGHLNASVRAAIAGGLHPVTAVQCASINTTRYFGIPARGAIAPGYYADLQIVEDLNNFKARAVYKEGRLIAENGKALHNDARQPQLPPKSFNVNWEKMGDLRVPLGSGALNVIGVIPGQIVTQRIIEPPKAVDGEAIADTDRDLLKIAVIERHKGTGNRGIGFIKGFGLREGALAGSVAHDSHNIITVGTNDRDMLAAAHEVEAMGGGLAAARDGKASARLPLRIAGLMSDRGIGETLEGLHAVVSAAKSMGCALENPYAVMSFMALTPIPELKLTDLGLFDSVNFSFVDLFTG